uniref:C2 domain-containing protein n=1 Tax=Peronospora matthiolae TaxID=2874970 RepID=A0AAV1TST5_9STRA
MKQDRFSVKVVLFKCHDLVAATNEVGGTCNAYVVFTLDGVTKKSSCVKHSLDPHWSSPEKFDFEVDKWEAEFLIAQVFDYSHQDKGDLIGSAVIPLALYAGNRNCEMCSYPLVLPDEVGGLGSPKSDMFLQISLLDADGSPVEDFYW